MNFEIQTGDNTEVPPAKILQQYGHQESPDGPPERLSLTQLRKLVAREDERNNSSEGGGLTSELEACLKAGTLERFLRSYRDALKIYQAKTLGLEDIE